MLQARGDATRPPRSRFNLTLVNKRGDAGGGVTATALMAELSADPDWVAARAEADAKMQRLAEQRRIALEPVTRELRAVGFDVRSPWELHKHSPYPEAIPVLLRHLRLPSYAEEPRAAIAQALAVPETRDHWREIVDTYRQTDPRQDRLVQALANVIDVTANRKVSDEFVELVFDPVLGPSRVLLLRALTRLRLPSAWSLVGRCLADPELQKEAAHTLHQRELHDRRQARKNSV